MADKSATTLRIIAYRDVLHDALGRVRRLAATSDKIPILNNVLLRGEDGGLVLRATNLDAQAEILVAADVRQKGAITVNANILHHMLGKLPDKAQVILEVDRQHSNLNIIAGTFRSNLYTLPASDFPDFDPGEVTHSFSVSASEFRLLGRAASVVQDNNKRAALTGILLHVVDDELRAVGTDGIQLALMSISAPKGCEGMPSTIVPRRALDEALRLLPSEDTADTAIAIDLSGKSICFTIGDVSLSSRLVAADFPNYAEVIPANTDKMISVERATFQSALDRIDTVTEGFGAVALTPHGDGRLTISGRGIFKANKNNDQGSECFGEEEIEVEYEGDLLTAGYNGRKLHGLIEQVGGDVAVIRLSSAQTACVLGPKGRKDEIYVLMAMRVPPGASAAA